jgi:serine/threonine protein kinase
MGMVMKNCLSCNKDKDKVEVPNVPLKSLSRKVKTKIVDKYCPGTITIEENTQEDLPIKKKTTQRPLKQSICLYANQFHSNPKKFYKISNDISEKQKIVELLSNSSINRFMTIIERGKNFNDKTKEKYFLESIKDLQALDHPNICKIYEVYIFDNNYYLISSYNGDNNMLKKIKNEGTPEEPTIKLIMGYIINSLIYLHENAIYNIGLKLEDLILFEMALKTTKKQLKKGKKSKDYNKENSKEYSNENIKELNSKNTSEEISINSKYSRKKVDIKISVIGYLKSSYDISNINCIKYYSPEIIEQIEQNNLDKYNIDQEFDNNSEEEDTNDEWALGVILYYLITGEFPFEGSTKEEIFKKIKNDEIDYSSSKFNSVSEECKDFLSKLLEKDKNNRLRCSDCYDHPFFILPSDISMKNISEEVYYDHLKTLLTIKKPRTKFHEIVIAYLCYNFIDKTEEKRLRDLFKYIDQEHDNTISVENIKEAFQKNCVEYTEEQIKNILYVFDYDNNNYIQYQEFLRVLCDKKDLFKEENLKSAFNVIDSDNSNNITFEDVEKFVIHDEDNENIIKEEFMEPFGMKPDDTMSFEQFYEIIKEDKIFSELNNDTKGFKSKLDKIKKAKKMLKNKEEKE